MAAHDLRFRDVARRNAELAACTHEGLLYCGPNRCAINALGTPAGLCDSLLKSNS
jgi:hypothetical protein